MKTLPLKLFGFALLTALASCSKSNDISASKQLPAVIAVDSTRLLTGWWAPVNYLVQAKIYFGDDHFFYMDTVGAKTPAAGFWTFKNKVIACSPTLGGKPTLHFHVTKLTDKQLALSTIGIGVLQSFSKTNDPAITTPPLSVAAGDGSPFSPIGDGGPALKAHITYQSGVAVDSKNNIYISDAPGIRKVSGADGIINTIVKGQFGALCIDKNDDLYYCTGDCVYKRSSTTGVRKIIAGSPGFSGYNGDGPATTHYIKNAGGIAIDKQGNLFIADYGNHLIREVVAATGLMRTIAGTRQEHDTRAEGAANTIAINPTQLAVDGQSNVYFVSSLYLRKLDTQTGNTTVLAGKTYTDLTNFSIGDNGPVKDAKFRTLSAVAVSPEGDIFVSDAILNTVRKIDSKTQIITRFAGTGYSGNITSTDGLHSSAYSLRGPTTLALDPTGKNLYISINGYRLNKVGPINN